MISVESLGIDFFFNGIRDVAQAERAKEVVNGLLSGLGKLIGVAGGMYKLGDAIRDFVNDAVELQNVARASNNSVDSLSAWSQAFASTGGDAQVFMRTVQGLSEAIKQSFIEGGPMRQYLHQLGVSAYDSNNRLKETTQILMDIANSPYWNRLSESEQLYVGKQLGLDEDTIRMLQRGGTALQEMIELQTELGIVSEHQAQMSRETYNAFYELRTAWKVASNVIVTALLPAVKWLMIRLRDISLWVVKNKPVLYGLIFGVTALIAKILIPVLVKLAAAWVVAFWPVALIIGILAALGAAIYLLYDDWKVWKEGGIAAFGEVWEKWDPIATAFIESMKRVRDFFKNVWDDPKKVWTETITYFENRWKGLSLVEIGRDIITSFKNSILETWNSLILPLLTSMREEFKSRFGFDLIEEGRNFLTSWWLGVQATWDTIKERFYNLEWYNMGKRAGDVVGKALSDAFESFLDFGETVDWKEVADSILNGLWKVIEFVGVAIGSLGQIILGFLDGVLMEIGTRIKEAIITAAKQAWIEIKNLPGSLATMAKEWITGEDQTPIPAGIQLPPGMGMPGMTFVGQGAPLPPEYRGQQGQTLQQTMTIGSIPVTVNNPRDTQQMINSMRNEMDQLSGTFFSSDGAVRR